MQQAAASTRWCPTPEQLMILEEMYRTGIRTPNAAQIRQITAHLSYYGKIEGKNVFYWFQNHKARDRQKTRRKLSYLHQQQNGQAQAQAHAQALLSHQIFHLQLSPHPPVTTPPPPSLLPNLHFPYQHHLRRHHPSHFLHQAASGYYHQQEPDNIIPPVMNLVRKLESPALSGKETDLVSEPPPPLPTTTILGGKEMGCFNVPYWRPLKTLDLFPTSTSSDGGLKDIDRIISSKSSSCSTSTTN